MDFKSRSEFEALLAESTAAKADLESRLAALEGELWASRELASAAERRVKLVEEAAARGVRNPRVALLAADSEGLSLESPEDWETLHVRFPELFRGLASGAGVGLGEGLAEVPDMNVWIRRAAGRS